MRLRAIVVASAGILLLASLLVSQLTDQTLPAQKPVKVRRSSIDGQGPPRTLAEMMIQADGVVIAKATGKTRLRDWGEGWWDTIYSFDVQETLKPSPDLPRAGGIVDVDFPGGVKEHPTYIERQEIEGYDVVRAQRRYVIFVRRMTTRGYRRLIPAWSAAGAYDVTGQRVRSLDTLFTRYNDTDPETFIANARAAAKPGSSKRP